MSDLDDQPLAVPPALRPGDGVSIVAPASTPDRAKFEAAIAAFEATGYRPKTYRDLCQPHGYLAGTDEARVAELNEAFADPDTTMVLAARGGYGCGRILDRVDFDRLKRRPKIVGGYSDLTALHAAVQRRARLLSFHGPNLIAGLGDTEPETLAERRAFFRLASGEAGGDGSLCPAEAGATLTAINGGVATGRLVGGNLAVLMGLVGTPYGPCFDGSVLLLEDIGEAPYRADRFLTQLRQGGQLEVLAGVVLGDFSDCGDDGPPSMEEVLREFLAPLGVPILAGFPAGHSHPNLPLPLGARVTLDADRGDLRLAQPAVAV